MENLIEECKDQIGVLKPSEVIAKVIIKKSQGDLAKEAELIAKIFPQNLKEEVEWVIGWLKYI